MSEMINVTPNVLTEEDLAVMAQQSSVGFFTEAGLSAGVTDSPLKARQQLETEDVVMRLLHIETVHITRALNDDGTQSDFPIIAFAELPAAYYTAGSRMMQIVTAWARAAGDEFEYDKTGFTGDRMLPHLNEAFTTHGQPGVVLKWKVGKRNKYVDVIIISG